jgi:hypothetical protein
VLVGLVGLRAPDLRINWKMQIKEFAWLNVCASQRWRALSLLYIFLFLIFSPLGSSHFNNLAFFTLFDSAGAAEIFFSSFAADLRQLRGEKIMQKKLAASPFQLGTYLPNAPL